MALILSFLVALMVTPLAMRLAARVHLLDHPGDLKVHTRAIPYLGGVGVAAGLAAGMGRARPALLVPATLALGLGVVDDARSVNPVLRLVLEVALGVTVAVVAPVRLPAVLAVVAVTAVVVTLVNGVNMIDGLDGLAGSVALVSALGFAVVLRGDDRAVALALAGGLAGFLVFNRPPARIYLGDGGAYLVGVVLAVLVCLAWSRRHPLELSLGSLPLVLCAAGELGFAVLRRMRSGSSLLAGDRSHVYDQLVHRGWAPLAAVGAYVVAQAILAAGAVAAVHLPPATAGAVALACALGLLGALLAFGFLSAACPETTE